MERIGSVIYKLCTIGKFPRYGIGKRQKRGRRRCFDMRAADSLCCGPTTWRFDWCDRRFYGFA